MMQHLHSTTSMMFLTYIFILHNCIFCLQHGALEITKSCLTEDTMTITGSDVKLSDFVRTNGDIYNLCSYKVRLKVVKVFALNTLIIDRDVDAIGSHFKLFFLAPKWLVIGNRRIAVDGAIGTYMPRANNGNSSNTAGEDGKPGLPGGPGGNFFGVGDSFINDHHLVITANGGIGGTGQYGGNGYDQQIGRYVGTGGLSGISCKLYYGICKRKDQNRQLNLTDNYGKISSFTCESLAEKENTTRCSFKIFGWKGEEGGKGGNGGTGGIGGLPGFVKLVAINNDSHISSYSILGKRGKDGEGGTGGRSGQNGYNFIYSNMASSSSPKIEREQAQKTFYHLGSNGSDGFNSVGYKEDLEASEVLKSSDIEHVLSEHKLWLREMSGKFVNDKCIVMFYRNLYDNNVLTYQLNVTYLLKEVQDIDKQFKKMKTDADFHPFYESVLRQVLGFAQTLKHNTSLEQERKVLILLYTDLLGRIFNTQQRSDVFIDIRIPTFVESERNKIQEIRSMTRQNQTFGIMEDKLFNLYGSKENYESSIIKLTVQTKWYLDSKIDSLIKSSIKVVKEVMEKVVKSKSMLKCSNELEGYLTMRSYLSSIQLFKDFFSICVDFSKIVCLTVKIGSRVPDQLRVNFEKKNDTIPSGLPELLQKLNASMVSFKNNEVTRVKELLKHILNKTKRTPKVLKSVTKDLNVVEMKLQNSTRLYAINALRSDLLKVLKVKKEELSNFTRVHKKAKKSSYVKKCRVAFRDLNGIIHSLSLGRGLIDVYNEYMAYDGKYTNKIVECCKTPKDFLHTTTILEKSIYVLMYPIMQRLEDITVDTSGNYEQLAKIALDFVKQELLYTLHRVQHSVRKLSDRLKRNFDSTSALNQISKGVIEILEDFGGVCTALIAVFDRLQTYFQLRQLENMIADTNVAVRKGIVFTDVFLSKDFEFIKQNRGSNFVLMHYKTVVETLKMFVFPLAQVYFKNIILPKHFNTYGKVDDVTDLVLTQLDNILKQVEDYKLLALTGDGILSRKFFGSQSGSPSEPFFVWKNKHHKDTFLKLLSGEKVLLNADITQSLLKQSAIKLNSLDFYFKAKKKEDQKRVDKMFIDAAVMVFANHSGNSQYRYNNDIYVTSSDSLELSYSYERDKYKSPIFQGGAYEFIKQVEVTLSPYTLWEIQLKSVEDALGGNESAFKHLVKLKDEVDLELGGVGFFVNSQKEDLQVKKYYKPIDA